MPKPDPALLDPSRYPFSCELQTRYTDVDTNLHVNNVAIVEIMQEARVRFHRACKYEESITGLTAMTVSFAVDYLGEAQYYVPLMNHVGGLAMGCTSHTLGQLITQEGNVVAFAQTIIVTIDNGKPAENGPAFREAMKDWMIAA